MRIGSSARHDQEGRRWLRRRHKGLRQRRRRRRLFRPRRPNSPPARQSERRAGRSKRERQRCALRARPPRRQAKPSPTGRARQTRQAPGALQADRGALAQRQRAARGPGAPPPEDPPLGRRRSARPRRAGARRSKPHHPARYQRALLVQASRRRSTAGKNPGEAFGRIVPGPCAPVALRRLRSLAVRYREQQPTFIPPMLLASGALPSGEAWAFELKWDGSLDSWDVSRLIHSVCTQAYGLIRGRGPAHCRAFLLE
jgi:hypothetical protein